MTTTHVTPRLEEKLTQLRTLRDEIRVDLHLAGMDARDEWNRLEKRLLDVEKLAQAASGTGRKALEELSGQFLRFREALRRHAS